MGSVTYLLTEIQKCSLNFLRAIRYDCGVHVEGPLYKSVTLHPIATAFDGNMRASAGISVVGSMRRHLSHGATSNLLSGNIGSEQTNGEANHAGNH